MHAHAYIPAAVCAYAWPWPAVARSSFPRQLPPARTAPWPFASADGPPAPIRRQHRSPRTKEGSRQQRCDPHGSGYIHQAKGHGHGHGHLVGLVHDMPSRCLKKRVVGLILGGATKSMKEKGPGAGLPGAQRDLCPVPPRHSSTPRRRRHYHVHAVHILRQEPSPLDEGGRPPGQPSLLPWPLN